MENIKWKNVGGVLAGVVFILLIVAYNLGYLNKWLKPNENQTTTGQTTSTTDGNTVNPSPQLQTVNVVDNSSSVGITAPPAPNGGKIRSVSMVGPSGVYNDIVQTDRRNYKALKTAFTPLLVNEGAVSTDDIKKVLGQYINESWKDKAASVSSNGDIQIVIASSVMNNPKVVAMLPELKKTYVVTTTSSDTEGAGGFKVAVAPQYQSTAFVMDITPTIIRFTYSVNGRTVTEVAKTGSKYYQNGQTTDQALSEIRATLAKIPQTSKQLCIVLWAAAAKELRQGANRYSSVPNYTGGERSTTSGLELINEVKAQTNANVVLDFDGHWFSTF